MISYNDMVYGLCEIKDMVFFELVNCLAMRRLKDISQAGYCRPFIGQESFNRFEHSVGVYLLLSKFGASEEERLAGLIHDVSHSAFSHCIDYVLDEGCPKTQNHQDNIFKDFVLNTTIPDILKGYGYDHERILDESRFPLLEKELPNLCADRIDYIFRSALFLKGWWKSKEVLDILRDLRQEEGYWFFSNQTEAAAFANLFYSINQSYFCGLPTALMFNSVGEVLRHALKRGYLKEEDLYTTDQLVLNKIRDKIPHDEHLSELYQRMNNKTPYHLGQEDYQYQVFCKSRAVDPLFKDGDKFYRLTQVDLDYRAKFNQALSPREFFISYQ